MAFSPKHNTTSASMHLIKDETVKRHCGQPSSPQVSKHQTHFPANVLNSGGVSDYPTFDVGEIEVFQAYAMIHWTVGEVGITKVVVRSQDAVQEGHYVETSVTPPFRTPMAVGIPIGVPDLFFRFMVYDGNELILDTVVPKCNNFDY